MKRRPKKVTTKKPLSARHNYRLARMDRKVAMGANSGKTARAISRHQAIANTANALNDSSFKTENTVKADINIATPGHITNATQTKPDKPNKDSTDILGWMN